MKTTLAIFLSFYGLINSSTAQNISINSNGSSPDPKAILDINSSNKGVLLPRVHLKDSSAPITGRKPEGLLVWNDSTALKGKGFYFWQEDGWKPVATKYISGQGIAIDSATNIISTTGNFVWPQNDKPSEEFVKHFSCIPRPLITANAGNTAIAWSLVDSTVALHSKLNFDSVVAYGSDLRCYYSMTVKNVLAIQVASDETLASWGISCGGSVGNSFITIRAWIPSSYGGKMIGAATGWSIAGFSNTILTHDSATGLTRLSPSQMTSTDGQDGVQLSYEGDNNYHVRRSNSAGGAIIAFYLVDNVTNQIIKGVLSAADRVYINTNKIIWQGLPMQQTTSNGFPSLIFTANANFWVDGVMEVYMLSNPVSAVSNKIKWQHYKTGSANYATNYRITRALQSAPDIETTIYTGPQFETTDTGLISNTVYLYKMYATTLGTEKFVTTEKCQTKRL